MKMTNQVLEFFAPALKIPTKAFENLMLKIPQYILNSPEIQFSTTTISVERHLKDGDISEYRLMAKREGELWETLADIKRYCINKDVEVLIDLVNISFEREFLRLGFNPDSPPPNLIQIVEVDITANDFPPFGKDFPPFGNDQIHYQVFTKRGLALRDEISGEFKQLEKKNTTSLDTFPVEAKGVGKQL